MSEQRVFISNLKEETKTVYADEIRIEVELSDDDTERLYDFIKNMPPRSTVPLTVRFILRCDSYEETHLKVDGIVNRGEDKEIELQTELTRQKWWDWMLKK